MAAAATPVAQPIPNAPNATQGGAKGACAPLPRIAMHLGYLLCGFNHDVMSVEDRSAEVASIIEHSTFHVPDANLPTEAWGAFVRNLGLLRSAAMTSPVADATKRLVITLAHQTAALAAIWDKEALGLAAEPGTDL